MSSVWGGVWNSIWGSEQGLPCSGKYTPGMDQYTKLLLHSNTYNASTVFTNSVNGGAITVDGGVIHSTAQSTLNQTSSIQFGDGDGDRLKVPWSSSFELHGDFVVDFRIRVTTHGTNDWFFHFGNSVSGCRILTNTTTNKMYASLFVDSVLVCNIISTDATPLNEWFHYAFIRQGNSARAFINGVQTGPTDTSSGGLIVNGNVSYPGLFIGSDAGPPNINTFDGYMSEVRLSVGTDRGWFNGFIPPTAPYCDVG